MAKYMLHYTLPNVWKIGSLRFLPGINEVDSAAWDKVKDHPLLQERFDKGALVWVRGPKDKPASPSAEPKGEDAAPPMEDGADALAGTTVDEAKKLVANTFSQPLLEKWAESETRKSVLKAIEAQMETIKPKPEDFREKPDGNDGK